MIVFYFFFLSIIFHIRSMIPIVIAISAPLKIGKSIIGRSIKSLTPPKYILSIIFPILHHMIMLAINGCIYCFFHARIIIMIPLLLNIIIIDRGIGKDRALHVFNVGVKRKNFS